MQDIKETVRRALAEDIGHGDVTVALIPEIAHGVAEIVARESLCLCGVAWVNAVFLEMDPDCTLQWFFKDSDWVEGPAVLCRITGRFRGMLTAERTALNLLQTLSGTATATYHYQQRLRAFPKVTLLDTRKTIPGLRMAQKYAVVCGGGQNHRMGLYDAYLIKENHIKACGSISAAIQTARQLHPELWIEVEVETLEELREALLVKPNRILLDNFTLDLMMQAVNIRDEYGTVLLEVSGGVTLATIEAIAKTGVDCISVGDLTKSLKAIDLSLLIRESL